MKIEDYQSIAAELIANDRDRDEKFREIDAVHNVKWDIPKEWAGISWLRPYPSTKAADSLDVAIRALSTKNPQLSLQPILPNEETRAQYDTIERVLQWNYVNMAKRSQANPTRSIVASAVKYDEVCVNVVHIPSQNKQLTGMNSKTKAMQESYGPFSLIVHNPRNVHVQYSDMMPERVLLCKRQPVQKVLAFWGDSAKELRKLVDGGKKGYAYTDLCDVYDITDSEYNCVWVEMSNGSDPITIMPDHEHKLGFLNWACRTGGTSIDDSVENSRRPLLNSIVNGNLWNTVNLYRSLMFSLTMTRAAEPVTVSTTATGEGVDVDATEALGQYKVKTGDTVSKLPPSEVGRGVSDIYQMLGGEMETSAGINLLQMNSAPSGMAFATYNAVLQSAMGSINPYKQTSENVLFDVFGLMIKWLKYSKEPLMSYDNRKKNVNAQGLSTYGAQEIINTEDFPLPDPQGFYGSVKLVEYVPSDEMGKITSISTMKTNLDLSNQRALEALDVVDPDSNFEEWSKEQKDKAAILEEIKDMQAQADLIRQENLLRMQIRVQAEGQRMAAEAQQAAQQPPQGGDQVPPGQPGSQSPLVPPGVSTMDTAMQGMSGQQFNPAAGGTPTNNAAPGYDGMNLPMMEGRDNRGLRIPPNTGRPSVA